MANFATLKAAIVAAIKQNENNEITGNLLQQQLLAMVNSLGVGYQYVGIATPATNPGTPDQNVFYLASTAGTYTNFGGLVLADGEIAILKYNGAWSKDSTGAASLEMVNQLGQELGEISFQLYGVWQRNIHNKGYGKTIGVFNLQHYTNYTYTIKSSYTGTLYFAFLDKDGNEIHRSIPNPITSFPHTGSFHVNADIVGYLIIGCADDGDFEIEISADQSILKSMLKDWILGESFTVRTATRDSDGLVSSANITWPDGKYGTLAITRDGDGNATQMVAVYDMAAQTTFTLTVVRDADGNVTSTNIN